MRLWRYFYRPVLNNLGGLEKEIHQNIWIKPAKRIKSLRGENNFYFLGSQENYKKLGWNSNNKEKLWLYNLHYFDYLNSHDSTEREAFHKDIIKDWIKNNSSATYTLQVYNK